MAGAFRMLIFHKGQQRDFAGAFDRDSDHPLLFGRGAGAAAWDDFAPIISEGAQKLDIFIVHRLDFVDGQRTDLAALEALVRWAAAAGPSGAAWTRAARGGAAG